MTQDVFSVVVPGFIIMLALFAVLFIEIRKLKRPASNESLTLLNQNLNTLQSRIDTTTKTMNERLDLAAQAITQSLASLSHMMGNVGTELGGVRQIGQSLQRFHEFLNSPKRRGTLGEQILNELIEGLFPRDYYELQHKFRDGQTVDAILKIKNGHIPIDAKFPLESYRALCAAETEAARDTCVREFTRAIKKHIDDVSKKYIVPREGTVNFAVMYVPSEEVHYEIITNNPDVVEHAKRANVLLVSPNSFVYFLRVILMGLERAEIAEDALKIWEMLKGIQGDFIKLTEASGLVNRHLTNAKNAADELQLDMIRVSGKLEQVKLFK